MIFRRSPTAVTLLAAIFVAISIGGSARAQDTMHDGLADQLLACDDIVDLTMRLTCFNAIVDSLKPAAMSPVAEIKSDPVQDSDLRAPELEPDPDPEPEQSIVSAAEPEDFGRDSMKTDPVPEDKEPVIDNIQAIVVRAWKNHDGRFSVELDNNQIWRETQGTRVNLPKKGQLVTISTGRLGGYRMKIDGIKKLAWVRRIK